MKRFKLSTLFLSVLLFTTLFSCTDAPNAPSLPELPTPTPHEHEFSEDWSYNAEYHYHLCSGCSEISDNAEHTLGKYIYDKNATAENAGTKTATCSVCGYKHSIPYEIKYCNVILASYDAAKKIPVIKAVREITGLGLGETKALVESAPALLKENVSYKEALEIQEKIVAAGGTITFTDKDGNEIIITKNSDDDPTEDAPVTPPTEEDPETYTVILNGFDAAAKIPVIKAVREITGLGLGEAKALVESAPAVLKEDLSYADALEIQKKITEAGGKATITIGNSTDTPITPPADETTGTYTVILDGFDAAAKIPVIKAVREITGLGLGEAKALVESAPAVLKEGLSYEDALEIQKKINEVGGKASIKKK